MIRHIRHLVKGHHCAEGFSILKCAAVLTGEKDPAFPEETGACIVFVP
jgi:hypothetical protein